ncbi:MAG: MFS transporter [Clostridia bacterium]|nr:MFS transporter [Clostridia bacterium]
MEERKFTRLQARILTICFIVYFCAYIGRLNMSASLDSIMLELHVNEALGGTLQTVFAIVYASGQFVFGSIVDRVRPKRLILSGLLGSALCNLLFSFAGNFTLLIALWAVNGAFQSMLWTPIVRYLAAHFEGARRSRASFTMSFTLAGGHIAAWGLAELMMRAFGWRFAFALPALVLITAALLAFIMMPSIGPAGDKKTGDMKNYEKMPVNALFSTGLIALLLCSATNGFLRDGVVTWAPTILGADDGLFTLIIPVVNMVGILIGSTIVRMVKRNIRLIAAAMMLACVIPSLLLWLFPNAPVFALSVFLGTMSAILYGSNTMFTVLMPMEYDKAGRVGLVAGLIDSSIYLGSAFAGTFTGYLRVLTGAWTHVYACWVLFALAGALLALISVRGSKRF